METLKSLLNDLNINTKEQLRVYIDENYGTGSVTPFKILKSSDLIRGDSEDRVYCLRFEYERTIFDMDRIEISNAKEINIKDCIFTGSLRIGNREEHALDVFMDYVAFGKGLVISGASTTISIDLTCVNSPEAKIVNNEIAKSSISSCNICSLIIGNCTISGFESYFNKCEVVSISENNMGNVVFPHGQIDIFKQKAVHDVKWRESLKDRFSYLKFPRRIDLDLEVDLERLRNTNETFRFLIGRSDYHLNKGELSRLKYLELVSSINNPVKRCFYRAFGGLIIPWRILALIVTVIVSFGFLYLIPCFTFNAPGSNGHSIQRGLCILEALYFSGISFTTIGYGDISPVGYARVLAVSEGLLGVILSSSFLVSLVRRYID